MKFNGLKEYIARFEPLLVEECRAQVRNGLLEGMLQGRGGGAKPQAEIQ